MPTQQVSNTSEFRELPPVVSYIKLNPDGSWEDAGVVKDPVYIEDMQFSKLWDPVTIQFLRQTYGEYIGVMHHVKRRKKVSSLRPRMFVLGA